MIPMLNVFPFPANLRIVGLTFDAKYNQTYQQYPVPSGLAWAPIMDAYRAAQPKTDTDPVR